MFHNIKKNGTTVTLSLTISSLLFLSIVLFPIDIGIAKAEPRTIVVPDDYQTIVDAVGNATEGDTIFVKKGIYKITSPDVNNTLLLSGLEINKTLSIIGEDPENTVIVFPPDTRQGFILMFSTKLGFNVTADNCEISNLTITNCDYGIILHGNRVRASNIVTSCMAIYGNYCNLIGNSLYGTYYLGLYVEGSFNNFVQLEASGIVCYGSYNYWDDYSGSDSNGDGIGDTPYTGINDSQDNYPLMGPITPFDAGTWEWTPFTVNVVSNSTVSGFSFSPESAQIQFNVVGENNATGFCSVIIPKNFLTAQGNWDVRINEDRVTPTVNKDTNNTYLYFTYNHSAKTVKILGTYAIPEFPSWTILPLFLVAVLFAVVLKKRFYSLSAT